MRTQTRWVSRKSRRHAGSPSQSSSRYPEKSGLEDARESGVLAPIMLRPPIWGWFCSRSKQWIGGHYRHRIFRVCLLVWWAVWWWQFTDTMLKRMVPSCPLLFLPFEIWCLNSETLALSLCIYAYVGMWVGRGKFPSNFWHRVGALVNLLNKTGMDPILTVRREMKRWGETKLTVRSLQTPNQGTFAKTITDDLVRKEICKCQKWRGNGKPLQ